MNTGITGQGLQRTAVSAGAVAPEVSKQHPLQYGVQCIASLLSLDVIYSLHRSGRIGAATLLTLSCRQLTGAIQQSAVAVTLASSALTYLLTCTRCIIIYRILQGASPAAQQQHQQQWQLQLALSTTLGPSRCLLHHSL
jgi:hypothetical protein